MAAEAKRAPGPVRVEELDGNLYVFVTADANATSDVLRIDEIKVNGNMFIFANCTDAMIAAVQQRIASSKALHLLSPQQLCCLQAVGRGLTAKQIARELRISPRTVEEHLRRCRRHLGVFKTIEATVQAIEAENGIKSSPVLCPLTLRQLQCLNLTAKGATADAAAAVLGISARSVNAHLQNARQRLGVATTRAVVAAAVKGGWFRSLKPSRNLEAGK